MLNHAVPSCGDVSHGVASVSAVVSLLFFNAGVFALIRNERISVQMSALLGSLVNALQGFISFQSLGSLSSAAASRLVRQVLLVFFVLLIGRDKRDLHLVERTAIDRSFV